MSPRFFNDGGFCSPCEANCRTCYGPRQDQCASCVNGSFLLNTSCHGTCPPSHYPVGTECLPCYQNCLTCKGMYTVLLIFRKVIICLSNYFHFTISGGSKLNSFFIWYSWGWVMYITSDAGSYTTNIVIDLRVSCVVHWTPDIFSWIWIPSL